MLTGLLNIFYYQEDESVSCSVMSNSLWPHGLEPTRLLCPWDSPGKNTGVSCHILLQCMKVKSESEVSQSCSTLSDPMDCSLPGSSVHGIFQARVLEGVAIAFSICMDRYVIKISMKKLRFTFDNHLQNGKKIRKLGSFFFHIK